MEAIALTRASQVIEIADTLERLGWSAERMLGQLKQPMWHFCDPDDLIPTHHIHALMDHAARRLGSPTFGLLVGADNSIATLGSFGRLIASALTPFHAFKTACRLIHLQSSCSRLRLIEAGDEVWLCRHQIHGPKVGRDQTELYALMRLIELVGMAAGPSWRPAKVRLQTREAPECELREALGDPEIRIGQKLTAIAVPRGLLAEPIWRRREALGEAAEALERRLRHTAPGATFVDTLRQLIRTMLRVGPPHVETMAGIADLSVRSLQRRLAEQGASHSDLVEQARYQAAAHFLEHTDVAMTDIALELGYSDSAHFTRAFRRWSGLTPRDHRRGFKSDLKGGDRIPHSRRRIPPQPSRIAPEHDWGLLRLVWADARRLTDRGA